MRGFRRQSLLRPLPLVAAARDVGPRDGHFKRQREFPRIPFYADFWKWADWGEKLMALHIGYETVEPWPLQRIDTPDEKSRKAGLASKALLRANKDTGNIQLDGETQLSGVPAEAWTYKLGNRSALE